MKIRAVEQRKQAAKVRVEKLSTTFRSKLLSASPVAFTPPPLDASKRTENPQQQRPIVGQGNLKVCYAVYQSSMSTQAIK